MRIEKIASNAKYRKDNSKTWQFFGNLRNFENLLIFKFDNSKNLLKFTNSQDSQYLRYLLI